MGNLHSRNPRLRHALAPSGLAEMDGAVAPPRHDASGREDGRRAASAPATRPSTACYSVREVLPPSKQHPTAGGGRVLLPEPPARKRPLFGRALQAVVDFALQSLRGGADVLEVLEAYSVRVSTLYAIATFVSTCRACMSQHVYL
jgi:hypothetical protein